MQIRGLPRQIVRNACRAELATLGDVRLRLSRAEHELREWARNGWWQNAPH